MELTTLHWVTFITAIGLVWANHNPFGDVIRIYGGNSQPMAPCIFPFEYKGVSYKTCTFLDHVRPWCATTPTYTRDKRWGNCLFNVNTTRSEIPTFGGNADGARCHQPFYFNGVAYYGCINALHHEFWCATTRNYDQDKKWGNCELDVAPSSIRTTGGNSKGALCAGVFFYYNRLYFECTKINHDRPWCATTYDYRKNKKWGECLPSSTKISNIKTWGGTSGGSNCTFPSIYKGKTINECITSDHMHLWCPTTPNYDKDKRWGNCIHEAKYGRTFTGQNCVFPFVYEGQTFSKCTTAMTRSGKPWCATVARLAKNGNQWGFCLPVVDTIGGNGDGAECYFPYIYKGRKHYTCIDHWNDGMLWCPVTPNYDKDKKWGNCVAAQSNMLALGGNAVYGEPCVFPFKYQNEMFNQCITKNHDGKWCATTIDYDKDRKWGNCPA